MVKEILMAANMWVLSRWQHYIKRLLFLQIFVFNINLKKLVFFLRAIIVYILVPIHNAMTNLIGDSSFLVEYLKDLGTNFIIKCAHDSIYIYYLVWCFSKYGQVEFGQIQRCA